MGISSYANSSLRDYSGRGQIIAMLRSGAVISGEWMAKLRKDYKSIIAGKRECGWVIEEDTEMGTYQLIERTQFCAECECDAAHTLDCSKNTLNATVYG